MQNDSLDCGVCQNDTRSDEEEESDGPADPSGASGAALNGVSSRQRQC